MAYSYELKFTVPFYDLDPMRIVWHGNYLKYFDQVAEAMPDMELELEIPKDIRTALGFD